MDNQLSGQLYQVWVSQRHMCMHIKSGVPFFYIVPVYFLFSAWYNCTGVLHLSPAGYHLRSAGGALLGMLCILPVSWDSSDTSTCHILVLMNYIAGPRLKQSDLTPCCVLHSMPRTLVGLCLQSYVL